MGLFIQQEGEMHMGRISTKENKTVYQISRENLGYSREKASEVLGWISPERIEKIGALDIGDYVTEEMRKTVLTANQNRG